MNKVTSLIMIGLAASLAGCADQSTSLPPPGHYEHTSSTTRADGTSVDRETATDVAVDQNGNRVGTTQTTTTTDPPGLFNAHTSTSSRTVR